MLCKYAFNKNNKLVYIDDVENGKSCDCHCPCCKEELIAKNRGNVKDHHFAHISGSDCAGYKETLLHIWSKQIIEEYKTLSIPKYKSEVGGALLLTPYDEKDFSLVEQKLQFVSVEIEQRTEINELRPDIIGVTNNGLTLWIEICVTHKCSAEKISCIKDNNINCIEITIPDDIDTKESLIEFLINSNDSDFKCFINYPFGENIIQKNKKEYYDELKLKCQIVDEEHCNDCFKNIILQKNYSELLNEYRDRLPKNYRYIYKYRLLKDLIYKYPKLKYLSNALLHERFNYKSAASHLDENSFNFLLEFTCKLVGLIECYGYGSVNSFHWNCENIFAQSIKNGKVHIFCVK